MGWRGEHEVLIHHKRLGLLAWNTETGQVVRIAAPSGGTISLAVMGCPTRITIKGITTACMS